MKMQYQNQIMRDTNVETILWDINNSRLKVPKLLCGYDTDAEI